jgi:hypothetical protein
MRKFKLWILKITIALWKRRLRVLGEETAKVNGKLTLVQAMYNSVIKEGEE